MRNQIENHKFYVNLYISTRMDLKWKTSFKHQIFAQGMQVG